MGLLSILTLGIPRPSCLLTMPKYTLSSMMDPRTLFQQDPISSCLPSWGNPTPYLSATFRIPSLYKAFDSSTFQTFPTKQPLPSSVLQGMLTDKHRHLRCSRFIYSLDLTINSWLKGCLSSLQKSFVKNKCA